ncbi:MAG: glutamine synthetase family protein [Chloroflexota bacterium]
MDDLLDLARRDDIRLVRFLYVDNAGVTRGKAVTAKTLARKLVEGVGLTRAQMAMNLLEQVVPVEGMEPVGEIRLVPDPDTWTILPWAPGCASLLCNQLDHDRQDWGACPRLYLQRMINRAANQGIRVEASFENEFYLLDQEGRPFDRSPVYSSIGLDASWGVMSDILKALDAQGISAEQAINEYGPGQEEISIRSTPALDAADRQVKLKDTVRGAALQHALHASFAPKPFPSEIGSGAHLHLSLWDADSSPPKQSSRNRSARSQPRNLLYDAARERGLSDLGRHAVGGMLAHLPGLLAITCPSYNSYRRLQPGAWASAYSAWGFDNREAAVRVASPFWGRENQTFNLELKPIDGSANPYVALGATIAAMLDGIERRLDPREPCEHDPAGLGEAQRAELGISPLPSSLASALDRLEHDDLLLGTFPDLLRRSFLAVRRSELEAFSSHDEEYELAWHRYRY